MTLQIKSKRIYSIEELPEFALREADALECLAGGLEPREMVKVSIEKSFAAMAEYCDGELAVIWGYMPRYFLGDTAYIWLLTTTKLNDYVVRMRFAYETRKKVRIVNGLYRTLHAQAWIGHHTAKHWLEWLGFVAKEIVLVNGNEFYSMELERK